MVLLIVLLFLLAVIAFGVGFAVHWLFIAAIVILLAAVISYALRR